MCGRADKETFNTALKEGFSPQEKELKIQVIFTNRWRLANINTPISMMYNILKKWKCTYVISWERQINSYMYIYNKGYVETEFEGAKVFEILAYSVMRNQWGSFIYLFLSSRRIWSCLYFIKMTSMCVCVCVCVCVWMFERERGGSKADLKKATEL